MIPMNNPSLFTAQEMSARLQAVREEMRQQNLSALITNKQANVRYCTGFRGEPHTLFLTEKDAVLYTSFRTLPWAEDQTSLLSSSLELSIADPNKNILSRISTDSLTIGMDQDLTHSNFIQRSADFHPHQLIPSDPIERVRRVKSPTELQLIEQSQRLTESIFQTILPKMEPGITERQAQGIILSEIAIRDEVDCYAFPPIVATGGNAWEIHHLPDQSPIKENTMLLIDLGVVSQGYASDMTRTVCLGQASSEMREVYEVVAHAQEAAIACMLPGAITQEVDQAARKIISNAGYAKGFTHGLGHSIGLETHDPGLNLSPSSAKVELETGMVFTVEPGTYLADAFGVRIEDIVAIGEESPTNLTKQNKNFVEL